MLLRVATFSTNAGKFSKNATRHKYHHCFSTLAELRVSRKHDIDKLAEVVQTNKMLDELRTAAQKEGLPSVSTSSKGNTFGTLAREEYLTCIKSALATTLLHTEARTASMLGEGFYTIGPCGEELIAAVGIALEQNDSMALHYRHLGTQIARQLGQKK